jgi:hypothetical protein
MRVFVYRVNGEGKTLCVPAVNEFVLYNLKSWSGLKSLIGSVGLCRFILSFIALYVFGFVAVTSGRVIVSREWLNSVMIQHEFVHVLQWLRYGWRFPFVYVGSFLRNFLFGKSGVRFSFLNAYRMVRFEREAFEGSTLSAYDFLEWVRRTLGVDETVLIKI